MPFDRAGAPRRRLSNDPSTTVLPVRRPGRVPARPVTVGPVPVGRQAPLHLVPAPEPVAPVDAGPPPVDRALLVRFLRGLEPWVVDGATHDFGHWTGAALAAVIAEEFGEFTHLPLHRTPHTRLMRSGEVVWLPAGRCPGDDEVCACTDAAELVAPAHAPFHRRRGPRSQHPAGTGRTGPSALVNLHAMDELREAVARHAGLRPVAAAPRPVAPVPAPEPETDVLTAPSPFPVSPAPTGRGGPRPAPVALDCALPGRWALRGAAMNRIVARAATHSPQGHEIARELADMIRGLDR